MSASSPVTDIETKVTLNNGVEMPYFGLGVYLAGSGEGTTNAVLWALEAGYRLIDTASMYGNERQVGIAIRESGVPREDVFVTTKLWNSDQGYEPALAAFEESLERLDIGYIDLFLIHYPVEGVRKDSWRALEALLDDNRCRAIGVSNYTIRHLEELLGHAQVIPAVNQVEFSPYLFQEELMEFCRGQGIQLEGYAPLTRTRKFGDPRLREVASRYGKTPAQVLIRWALQHDVVTIPKSSNRERIEENADVFDFRISDDDMRLLDSFDEDFRITWDPTDEP